MARKIVKCNVCNHSHYEGSNRQKLCLKRGKRVGKKTSDIYQDISGDITEQEFDKYPCPLGIRCFDPYKEHSPGSKVLQNHTELARRIEEDGEKLKVSLDIDNTVGDFSKRVFEEGVRLGLIDDVDYEEPDNYGMKGPNMFKSTSDMLTAMHSVFANGKAAEFECLEEGLDETIQMLQKYDIEINAITFRDYSHMEVENEGDEIKPGIPGYTKEQNQKLADSTKEWIRNNAPSVNSLSIVGPSAKHYVKGVGVSHVFLEDSLGEYNHLTDKGLNVIIRDQKYNRDVEGLEDVRRVSSLRDLFPKIVRAEEEKKKKKRKRKRKRKK